MILSFAYNSPIVVISIQFFLQTYLLIIVADVKALEITEEHDIDRSLERD